MAAPLTEAQKLAALEPDFRFLLSEEEGIPTATIAAIYDLGYTSCKLWAKFDSDEAGTRQGLRQILRSLRRTGPKPGCSWRNFSQHGRCASNG